MDKNEKTMRLSEDSRFIKHVSDQLRAYGDELRRIDKELAKAGKHRKRGGYERLYDAGIGSGKALAGEFEKVLTRTSALPATIRMTVAAIGNRALRSYAHDLAEDKEESKGK